MYGMWNNYSFKLNLVLRVYWELLLSLISDKSHTKGGPYQMYGYASKRMTNSFMCDFETPYRQRITTVWTPTHIDLVDPPFAVQTAKIYLTHIGLLPNYAGHVPGATFRYGKTFGNDTINCRKWLRPDMRHHPWITIVFWILYFTYSSFCYLFDLYCSKVMKFKRLKSMSFISSLICEA